MARYVPPAVDVRAAVQWLQAEELVRLDGVTEVAGAAALLGRLDPARVAVVTSAPRELALRRLMAPGITPPDLLVSAEDVATGKPSPEGYLRAAVAVGVRPDACVVFEDAEAGIRAALAAGAETVVVGGHASSTTVRLPRIDTFHDLTVTVAEACRAVVGSSRLGGRTQGPVDHGNGNGTMPPPGD